MKTTMSPAATRAKLAYESNNIPWDASLAKLPVSVLNHVAECWERRAQGLPVDERIEYDRLTIREAKKLIDRVSRKLRACGLTHGARRFSQTCREYHGN